MDFSSVDGVISDMDGVLWRGEMALPGMAELFALLRRRGVPFVLATNNSGKSEAEYVEKLARLGAGGIAEREIVTSRTATAAYIGSHYPAGTRVYVVGTPGLAAAIAARGMVIADSEVELVVSGIDMAFSYEKLKRASLLIRAGAGYIATNTDASLPTTEGLLPGSGTIVAAIETATGVKAQVMGKPQAAMFEAALGVLGTAPKRTIMLGDRLNTDIEGAQRVGIRGVLVLTGVVTADEVAGSGVVPDAVYAGLPELIAAWERG